MEFLRRRGDFDIVFALGYQNMSPDDGNWLGKGKDPSLETDLVQFRDFAMIGVDVAFVQRRMFSRYFGFHYGAGLGLALVQGEILRVSNSENCNRSNAGNERLCRPLPCPPSGCTEAILRNTEGGVDGGPTMPSRFRDSNVPGAIPILNMAVGVDLRVPELRGFEAKLEAGFYNAFSSASAWRTSSERSALSGQRSAVSGQHGPEGSQDGGKDRKVLMVQIRARRGLGLRLDKQDLPVLPAFLRPLWLRADS